MVNIRSLADIYNGKEWAFVAGHVKKFMPYTGTYNLTDGSVVKRIDGRVVFHDDGIRIRAVRAMNRKSES